MRLEKGKSPLPDYYICRLAKGRRYATEGEPTGKYVSFRFDVVGHFRRQPDGRTIWVRPHQRGCSTKRTSRRYTVSTEDRQETPSQDLGGRGPIYARRSKASAIFWGAVSHRW